MRSARCREFEEGLRDHTRGLPEWGAWLRQLTDVEDCIAEGLRQSREETDWSMFQLYVRAAIKHPSRTFTGDLCAVLSLRIDERVVLIVASGTSRMDNKKVKALFGGKPKMLGLDEVAEITGHEVGGVCPFGLKTPLPVYCDVSLKAFDEIVPAAGSTHSAVRLTPSRMAELVGAEWVDVCEERS